MEAYCIYIYIALKSDRPNADKSEKCLKFTLWNLQQQQFNVFHWGELKFEVPKVKVSLPPAKQGEAAWGTSGQVAPSIYIRIGRIPQL